MVESKAQSLNLGCMFAADVVDKLIAQFFCEQPMPLATMLLPSFGADGADNDLDVGRFVAWIGI